MPRLDTLAFALLPPLLLSVVLRPLSLTHLHTRHLGDLAPLVALLAPFVVLVVQTLSFVSAMTSYNVRTHYVWTHLRQVDVRDDDLVQRTRGVSSLLAGVSARVVLVGGMLACVPGLGAVDLGDWVLGRG